MKTTTHATANPLEAGAPESTAVTALPAIASLSLAMLLPSLGTSIANVALPELSRHFSASFPQVQWVVLAYLVAVTALIVGAGRLGDLIGRRRLLGRGVLLFTVGSLLAGLAPSLGLLIAARAVQGLGAAVMMALTLALVGETVPKARIGGAMGLLGTMSAVGTALGPSLGGWLIAGIGWRAPFLVLVPLGLLCLGLLRLGLREPSSGTPGHGPRFREEELAVSSSRTAWRRLDLAGTVLLAVALGSGSLALTLGREHFGPANLMYLALATLAGILLVRVESRAAHPLVRLSLFRRPGLGAGLVLSLIVAAVMMATLVVGPFYLSRAHGLEATRIGLLMSIGPLVSAIAGVPAGRLVDRYGSRRLTFVGLLGMAAGAGTLALLPLGRGLPGFVVPIAVMTAHYALFQAANNTSVMGGIAAGERGVISGLLNLSRNLGLIAGTAVLGAVFTWGSSGHECPGSPDAAVAGLRLTFALATLLLVMATGTALRDGVPGIGRRLSVPA